ncbi:diguanylate cyclase [Aliikangiella maris]|uniref:diguanylate cyclase n=2 Tax=Aliikangiella maris TaxID=3162458 RepID=A0ABV2BWJ3_9GAMM
MLLNKGLYILLILLINLSSISVSAAAEEVTEFIDSLDINPIKANKAIEEFLASRTFSEEELLQLLYVQGMIQLDMGQLSNLEAIAIDGLARAKRLEHFKLINLFRGSLAIVYSQNARWPEAKNLFAESVRLLKNSEEREILGIALMQFGLASYYNGELKEALRQLLEAYNIFSEKKNRHIPTILQNIGLIYDATGNQIKAIEYFKKGLNYVETNKVQEAFLLYNLGYVFVKINQLEEGENYLNSVLQIAKEYEAFEVKSYALGQLSELEIKRENYAVARGYVEEAYQLSVKIGNKRLEDMSLFQMLSIYIKQKDFLSAKEVFKKLEWVFKQGDDFSQFNLLKLKAEMHIELEEFEKAARVSKKVFLMFNKIVNNGHSENQEVVAIQNEFESQIEEQKHRILEQKNQLQELKISKQKQKNFIYILGMSVLVIIILLLILFVFREVKVRQKIAKMAMTDELTKVSNRRNITQKAQEEFLRFKRFHSSCLFCIMDLDFFKNVNDKFGHDTGDYVLIKFAKAVTSVIREVDHFGRIGGEEWLLILPQTTLEEVSLIYNRIVEQCLKIDVPEKCPPVTFSMGVSILQDYDEIAEESVKRADEALYEAKRKGRNCYVVLP